jgi:hypothetical protein
MVQQIFKPRDKVKIARPISALEKKVAHEYRDENYYFHFVEYTGRLGPNNIVFAKCRDSKGALWLFYPEALERVD